MPTGQDGREAEAVGRGYPSSWACPTMGPKPRFERNAERRRQGEDAEGTTHRDLGVVLGEVDGILCVEGRLEGGEAGIEGRHEAEMNCPRLDFKGIGFVAR